MDKVYNRRYVLTVIEQKVELVSRVGAPAVPVVASQFHFQSTTPSFNDGASEVLPQQQTPIVDEKITSGGDSVAIRGLHIEADIKSASEAGSTSSSTTIRIFNMSPQTRAKVEKPNAYVVLQAGYGDNLGIIFKGNITSFQTVKEHPNVVTTLTCTDSDVTLRSAKVSYAWSPDFGTYGDVLKDIADKMKSGGGIAKGNIVTDKPNMTPLVAPDDVQLKGGLSFQGYLSQLLDKICDQFDYVWYITLNELYIHPKYYTRFDTKFTVNANLIKSARPAQDKTNDKPDIEKPTSIVLETFLDNRFKVGSAISLEGDYRGDYKVMEVSHKLSYEGNEWDTVVKMEAI